MNDLERLHSVVSPWVNQGVISEQDKQFLRDTYMDLIEAPRTSCTTCPAFWHDVQVTLRIYLRNQNLPVVMKQRKWLLANESGTLRLFGQSKVIVNEGVDNEDSQVLTDEMAEKLMETMPHLKEQDVFKLNPQYEEKAAASVASTGTGTAETDTGAKTKKRAAKTTGEKPLTKAQQKAAEKKAQEDAAAAAKAQEDAAKDANSSNAQTGTGENSNNPLGEAQTPEGTNTQEQA